MAKRTRHECNEKSMMNENFDNNDQSIGNDDVMIKVRPQKVNVRI